MNPLLLRAALALALLLPQPTAVQAAPQKPLKAFWLSPDWLLEEVAAEGRQAGSVETRAVVALVLDRVKGLGANAVMMEAWLRGYALSRMGAYPVYPLTRLSDGGDVMAIVLEEAGRRDIAVHAWVHCLFWRTDNRELTRPYHEGQTLWDDLVEAWLREGAVRVGGAERAAALACAQALASGRPASLGEIVRRSRLPAQDGLLQAFVPPFRAAGVAAPAWLVQTPSGDVHPAGAKDRWMTLYLNPEHPVVIERVTASVKAISEAYPGLAGINLDHIRYPRGLLNVPRELSGALTPGGEFPGGTGGALYKKWKLVQRAREAAVTGLVKGIRAAIRPEHLLSSAVHPLYYLERDEWPSRLSADDFVCQDWHAWDLDYALPMIYDSDAPRVGRVLKKLRFGLAERSGGRGRTTVVPGVNLPRLMRELPAWGYFDFDGLRKIRAGAKP